MQWRPGSPHVLYAPKTSHDDPRELFPTLEKIDALEFLTRVITQILRWEDLRRSPATSHALEGARMRTIPEPRRHLLFYYDHYANVVRGRRKISQPSEQTPHPNNEPQQDEPTLSPALKQALRRRWADLIRRVFELDPLLCPCGGSFRVVAFITEPRIVRKILDHLNGNANRERAPPPSN